MADGHHRCKSASRAARERGARMRTTPVRKNTTSFPAVLFPMSQMEILAYNRIVYAIPDNFLEEVQKS
ncbi:MAG: DUF1015 family protein [Balneolaceae bacterium]|nr:DUF1015 family protein [Balneolaceae bacterium]